MSFDDYCQNFVHTALCRVVNTSMFTLSKTWHEGSAHGMWKKPDRAGGCANNRDTFLKNPQVRNLNAVCQFVNNNDKFLLEFWTLR